MARGKGASDQRLLTPLRRRSPDAGAIPGWIPNRAFYTCFCSKNCTDLTPVHCFSTFSYPSHLNRLFLIVFLEDGLPEMLSKLGVLAERAIKKKNKSRDSSDCQKHMVKCQVAKILTVKTLWTCFPKIEKVDFPSHIYSFCSRLFIFIVFCNRSSIFVTPSPLWRGMPPFLLRVWRSFGRALGEHCSEMQFFRYKKAPAGMSLLRNAIFRYKKAPAGMLLFRNAIA